MSRRGKTSKRLVEDYTPKIVVIGGGTGLSVILRGLKEMPLDITAIVTVADDGGSSGILRDELKMPPPGDINNVLGALADVEPLLTKLLKYRFKNGTGLVGHSMGNLLLAALKEMTGDFVTGVQELSRVLAIRGRVLPASNQAIILKAEMDDGTIVSGESQIPKLGQKIKRVFIEPADVTPLQESLEAIAEADAILVGPGSLYTSLLPNLLVPKIVPAIQASNALKIYICNVMTQPGETDHYDVSHHLQAIRAHVGAELFDYIIVNDGPIPKEVQEQYAGEGARAVLLDDEVSKLGYRIIADEFAYFNKYLRHDARKLSQHIYELVVEWGSRKR